MKWAQNKEVPKALLQLRPTVFYNLKQWINYLTKLTTIKFTVQNNTTTWHSVNDVKVSKNCRKCIQYISLNMIQTNSDIIKKDTKNINQNVQNF